MSPPYDSLSGSTTQHSKTETLGTCCGIVFISAPPLSPLVSSARIVPKAHLTHNCGWGHHRCS